MGSSVRVVCLLMLSIFLSFSGFSQNAICGFDEIYQRQLKDPASRQKIQELNKAVKDIEAQKVGTGLTKNAQILPGPIYEIPVVVHVITKGDAIGTINNPSDQTIIDMINYCNQLYGSTNTYFPAAGNEGTVIPVRLTLAKRAPNCGATNGINRVNAGSNATYNEKGIAYPGTSGGANEVSIKALSKWPNDQYYNIWIVWRIDKPDLAPPSYVKGFSYFPGAFSDVDGMVISAGEVSYNTSTVAHEFGHAMGLLHTFDDQNPNVCFPNNDCTTDGDKVCDTDPVKSLLTVFPCPQPLDINPCTNKPYGTIQYNIMGYGYCLDRFTPGQRDRAVNILNLSRGNLLHSLGATAPSGQVVKPASCTQITNAYPNFQSGIGPEEVTFGDLKFLSYGYYTSVPGNSAYYDFTCNFGTDLNASGSYPLTVTTDGPNLQRCKAWIDFNNNGIFEDFELILSSISDAGTYTHTATITSAQLSDFWVATNTKIRMRIMADYFETPEDTPDFGPCDQLDYGQTKDFWVMISKPLPVSFSNFEAFTKNGILSVKWTTAGEHNTDYFIIEASRDGVHFSQVDKVPSLAANGVSATPLSYIFQRDLTKDAGAMNGIFAVFIALLVLLGIKKNKTIRASGAMGLMVVMIVLACNKKEMPLNVNDEGKMFIRIIQVDKNGVKNVSKVFQVAQE